MAEHDAGDDVGSDLWALVMPLTYTQADTNIIDYASHAGAPA